MYVFSDCRELVCFETLGRADFLIREVLLGGVIGLFLVVTQRAKARDATYVAVNPTISIMVKSHNEN